MKLSYEQIRELIYQTLPDIVCIVELYDDNFIYEGGDDRYYQVSYTTADGKLSLGEKTEVQRKVEYVKMQAAMRLSAAVGKKNDGDFGYCWDVQIIEFGPDKQKAIYWDAAPLRAALPMYEGAKVFALTEAQHQDKGHPYGKSVKDLVGWTDGVTENEKGFRGNFNILKSAKWLRDALVDAWDRGNKDLIGLSHDVICTTTTKMVAGRKMQAPLEVKGVTIDVVYDPAGGGKFIRMAAAVKAGQKEAEMKLEKLLAALKASRPEAYKSIEAKINDKTVTEDEVIELLAAAPAAGGDNLKATGKKEDEGDNLKAGGKKEDEGGETLKAANKVLEEARLVACGITLKGELADSGLPDISRAKLQKQFDKKVFETGELTAAITAEKEYIDKLTGSGAVAYGSGARITAEDMDKRTKMIDDFFEGKVKSFKAAYVNYTGDEMVTGDLKAAKRLTASINSGTFALALGDSITRKMVAEYNSSPFSDWRKIVTVNPVFDFRTNRRNRVGGYGDLQVVAQGVGYPALATPGEEEATYAASKKGGTEDITIEAIKNDDVGAIRRIPTKLSRAAARTLYKFVFDFLATNPTIYDTLALFHATHGNLATAVLAAASLAARRQAMLKQSELSSGQVLGIPPKYLAVPVDLDKTGYDLIASPRNSDFNPTGADFTRTLQMELIVVPYWTDTNNWFLAADPNDIPGIEIGFLDGREEPELFVQDQPNMGSMFSNDKLTYKIRHIYGGAVLDYRAFDGNIVP